MIKETFKKGIIFLLKIESKLILKKYKPKIVGVAGSVGKTSLKDAVALVLGSHFNVRKSEKSYNSQWGVPLTIIGAKSAWNNVFGWIGVLFRGLFIILKRISYPQWLVLEMGVGKPKDMDFLLSFVKPNVAIFNATGETPAHIEFFEDVEEIKREKAKIIESLTENDVAILNGDDKFIFNLKNKTKAKTLVYGFPEYNSFDNTKELDLWASNYSVSWDGINFKINYMGTIIPVRMPNVFGRQFVYVAMGAIAVGLSQGINLVDAVQFLTLFKPAPGRMNLLEGVKNSLILDDTYNSSPAAVKMALETIKELPAKRKIVVLGDMLELGKFAVDEHKKIGNLVKEFGIDMVFAVGPRAKFIYEEALDSGFNPKNIFYFPSTEETGKFLESKIKEGDLILIKGSQAMRMEKIVEEIMAHPEKKEDLLVRQEKEWLNR